MKLHWTKSARSDAAEAIEYIAQDNPPAAARWWSALKKQLTVIQRFPQSGHVVPEYDLAEIRELRHQSWRVVYQLRDDRIVLLRVLHGARRTALQPAAEEE